MAHHTAQQGARERRAWREAPSTEALAFDRWRLGSAIGGSPGESRIVRPGAFGLFFDLSPPVRFLDDGGKPLPGSITDDGIAILTVCGPLEHHASWWASYEDLAREVEIALRWQATRALVLKIDSPGGVVAGMGQAHRAIRQLQRDTGKKCIAWVDESACSAAYNIASACSEIWMPPEAQVGSIGVILCTVDESEHLKKEGIAVRYVVSGKRKADMQPGTAITDDVLKVAQAKVDQLADGFFRAVARARRMTPEAVADLEAAVFVGESAVNVGLADGVADWPAFLDTLRDTIGASVGTTSGTRGTSPAAKAKDRTMKLTAMQAAQKRTAAELAVTTAEKAYEKSPTLTTLAALNDARGELAKVIHHMKHEEKTVQVDDPPPPTGKPGSDAGGDEDDEDDEEARQKKAKQEEEERARKAKDAKKPPAAEGDEEEERKAIAAFASADARYLKAAREGSFDAYGVHGPKALLAACQDLTGEKTIAGTFGALVGLKAKLAASGTIERDVADMKAKLRKDEISALVDAAKHAGKTQGKEHRAELRSFGDKHGIAALKAAIKVLPIVARSQAYEAREDGSAIGAFQGSDAQLDAQIEAAAVAYSNNPDERKAYAAKLRENLRAQAKKIPAA